MKVKVIKKHQNIYSIYKTHIACWIDFEHLPVFNHELNSCACTF